MQLNPLAEIDVLWICENKPDRFSALIMWWLDRPYSHCAIRYKKTGMIWHATTPGGVREETFKAVMKGCHVAASYTAILNCSEERFEGFLDGEAGKGYGHVGNIALIVGRVPVIGCHLANFFFGRRHADQERNCSEFVGNIINRWYKELPGAKDKWKPSDLEHFLKPRRYAK
jgi:hypothetical protein